jgi:hypothetical protein
MFADNQTVEAQVGGSHTYAETPQQSWFLATMVCRANTQYVIAVESIRFRILSGASQYFAPAKILPIKIRPST